VNQLANLTVKQAVAALNSGESSSLELTTALLERTEALEPSVKAYITRTPELALEQARAADEKRALLRKNNSSIPALLGLPIADRKFWKTLSLFIPQPVFENYRKPAWL
jgi:Asp-tRNA(Asn)/Glu-tRNA(Gln) amidotransferase A subunit family amidase